MDHHGLLVSAPSPRGARFFLLFTDFAEPEGEGSVRTETITDQDGEVMEVKKIGVDLMRGEKTIKDTVWGRRCAGICILKFDDSEDVATGFIVRLGGKSFVLVARMQQPSACAACRPAEGGSVRKSKISLRPHA